MMYLIIPFAVAVAAVVDGAMEVVLPIHHESRYWTMKGLTMGGVVFVVAVPVVVVVVVAAGVVVVVGEVAAAVVVAAETPLLNHSPSSWLFIGQESTEIV
jgi:hypothetical protein